MNKTQALLQFFGIHYTALFTSIEQTTGQTVMAVIHKRVPNPASYNDSFLWESHVDRYSVIYGVLQTVNGKLGLVYSRLPDQFTTSDEATERAQALYDGATLTKAQIDKKRRLRKAIRIAEGKGKATADLHFELECVGLTVPDDGDGDNHDIMDEMAGLGLHAHQPMSYGVRA